MRVARSLFILVGGLAVSASCDSEAPRVPTTAANITAPGTSPGVAPGVVPTSLAVTGQPGDGVSGVNLAVQPVVQILDARSQVVLGSTTPVTAQIASGSGAIAGTVTENAIDGTVRFSNLRVNGAGPHTLTFTATGLQAATSNSLTITQTAAGLSLQSVMTRSETGAPLSTQPTLRVVDNAGLPVPNATIPVTASIGSGGGVLSGTTTVNAASGVATFTDLSISGSGSHSLTFSGTGVAPVTTSAFTVASATQLAVTQQPGGATIANAFGVQPVVSVRDAGGVLMSSSTAAVTATVASGPGTLSGTTTVNAVNGAATFSNLQLSVAGSYILTFSAPGLNAATSSSFNVTQPPASLAIQTQPTGATAGSSLVVQPVVEARDAAGDPATGAIIPVTATLASGAGSLLGTTTVVSVAGVARFTNLRVDSAGPHTISFATPGLPPVTSGGFLVTQPPSSMNIETQPATAVSGSTLGVQPSVSLRDATNQVVTGATSLVTATIASGNGLLQGTRIVNASGGIANYTDLRIDGSGPHILRFSSPGLPDVLSSSLSVVQVPTQLSMLVQPSGAISGSPFSTQPLVNVRDGLGAVVVGATDPVTASIFSGSGTLSGTTTVSAIDGVATFGNLTITGGGPHTLRFTSGSLGGATSTTMTVVLPPTQLAVSAQPSGAVSGQTFVVPATVQVRDASNAVVVGATNPVTAAISSGTGTLSGTTVVNATNGSASFPGLIINGTGAHTLSFTSGSLTPAATASFNVSALPAPNSEPTFTAGVDTSMYFENFESYASTTALRGAYATREIGGSVNLDALVALTGSKSFRADFIGGCLGNNDAAVLIERQIPANQPADRDWVLQWHTLSPGFKFRWDNFADCPRGGGNKEMVLFRDPSVAGGKFTFGQAGATAPECPSIFTPAPSFSLWILFMEADAGATKPSCSGQQQVTMQHLAATTKSPPQITDNAWHRLTLRLKKESAKDAGDGVVQFWIDGVLVMNYNGEDPASPAFGKVHTRTLPMGRIFQYPGTVNGGAPQNQSRWFDDVRFWVERGS
jgi:hypothetical protein